MKTLFLLLGVALGQDPATAELVDVRKIWDQAPHNAFTDRMRRGTMDFSMKAVIESRPE